MNFYGNGFEIVQAKPYILMRIRLKFSKHE